MFEHIVLEDEQRELLSQIVETERSLPRERRGRFILVQLHSEPFDTFIHTGGPQLEGHFEDVEILAAAGLLAIGYNSQGTPTFYVTPTGFQYYEHMKRTGAPDETVQEEIRRYITGNRFRTEHPRSFAKWSQAEELLWSTDSKEQLTTVGHLCREAAQEFAGGVPSRVEIEKRRILPVGCPTTNWPSSKTAAGGMRHGEAYQEVGAGA